MHFYGIKAQSKTQSKTQSTYTTSQRYKKKNASDELEVVTLKPVMKPDAPTVASLLNVSAGSASLTLAEPIVGPIVGACSDAQSLDERVQAIMATFKDLDGFGFAVQRIAKEAIEYSVQVDGYMHDEGLVYKMVAKGHDVFGMLQFHLRQ
jgi:hypothetical protein